MNEEIQNLKMEVQELRAILNKIVGQEKYIFPAHIQILDGRKITVGRTTGTMIGTEGYVSASNQGQKIGFFGKTPVVQASAISAPSSPGSSYSQSEAQSAVTAINSIRTVLTNIGITI